MIRVKNVSNDTVEITFTITHGEAAELSMKLAQWLKKELDKIALKRAASCNDLNDS